MPVSILLRSGLVRLTFFLMFLTAEAIAQSGRSWMNGLVLDESDTRGVINAMVELIGNPEDDRLRDVKLTTKTDEMGKYSFTNVPYGEYSFRVSAPGKVTYEIQIYIASDALTSLHVKLKKKR